MVEVKLLFFAKSRELTGVPEAIFRLTAQDDHPNTHTSVQLTGDELLSHIVSSFPCLTAIKDSVIVAVNQEYVGREQRVQVSQGDEVAVIPPISGGGMEGVRDLVRITADPLSVEEVTKFVTDPSAGAISTFIGTTRDHFESKTVVRLEYEAYTTMAIKQLEKICQDVRQKWPICKAAIVHRIGVVPVGEASVMVAVSSEHRKEAIEAVSFAIDAVKASTTIWKKEVYNSGNSQWKENTECTWSSAPS